MVLTCADAGSKKRTVLHRWHREERHFLFLIDGQNGFWRRDWDQIGNITFYLERRWDELVGGKYLLVWEEGHSDDAAKSGIGENHIVSVGSQEFRGR